MEQLLNLYAEMGISEKVYEYGASDCPAVGSSTSAFKTTWSLVHLVVVFVKVTFARIVLSFIPQVATFSVLT